MKIKKKNIQLDYPEPILDIVWSDAKINLFYAVSKSKTLLEINIENGVVKEFQAELPKLSTEKEISLKVSPNDKYLSIVNNEGQYGYVYNCIEDKVILELDRKDYHVEQTRFPVSFFTDRGTVYLIHATDWNHLDMTNLETGELITKRNTNKYEKDTYLDYFYGELHLSPGQKMLLSSGWIWQPFSVIRFIDLQKWLVENTEPETSGEGFVIMSYDWDRPVCWTDEQTIAYLFAPKEEGDYVEDEKFKDLGMEIEKSYLLIRDVFDHENIKVIEFNHYPKNEYHETTPDCRVFYNSRLIVSSKKYGTFVVDAGTGNILHEDNELYVSKYTEKHRQFYDLKDKNRIETAGITK